MEKQYRTSSWIWVGSILIALLIIGSLGFGAYRFYAMGWTRGVAAVQDGSFNETPHVQPVQPYRYYLMGHSPILWFLLTLIVFGAVFRHSACRMHPARYGWRRDPSQWSWHPHYPDTPNCKTPRSQNTKVEDDEEGAV